MSQKYVEIANLFERNERGEKGNVLKCLYISQMLSRKEKKERRSIH